MPRPIYLDHNATTPIFPEVMEVMRACWAEPFLNPASQHEFGRKARYVLEGARETIADFLGADTRDGVLFTSGGTESNYIAIRSSLQHAMMLGGVRGKKPHLVISAAEHPSIAELAKHLQLRGHEVEQLPLDKHGVIQANALPRLLRKDTALVAAILGQNETGVIQPVAELAAICASRGIPLHTDATQVAGKLPIDFKALGAASMTIAAHKFHGPVGIGALIVRSDVQLHPQMFGGFQQNGLRPGTESVALAAGMARALQGQQELDHEQKSARVLAEFESRLRERAQRLQHLRDSFEQSIVTRWPSAVVIGTEAQRLPHVSNIALVGLDRQMLFLALDQAGIACSTGSACASGSSEPSPVHLAMGLDPAVISSALRFSFGVNTTAEEVAESADRIINVCNTLRR
jgi:cysteine desulfurase